MRILIGIAAVAIVGAGYKFWADHSKLVRRLDTIERHEREADEAPVAAPAATPMQLLTRTITPQPAAPVASAEVAGPADVDPEAMDPGPSKEEFSAELDDFFTQQATTASSRNVQAELSAALDKLPVPDGVRASLDCRGSVCRADFANVDESQGRELIMGMSSIGWTGPLTAFILDDGRGGKSVRVFAAQPGAELPMPH